MAHGNKVGGIVIAGAGAGNVVRDNTVVSNGRYGIDVQNASEVRVEGNRVSYSRGTGEPRQGANSRAWGSTWRTC